MKLNREKRRKEIEQMINNRKTKIKNGEITIENHVTSNGLTPKQLLKNIQENGLPTYFDYPGGFIQFKKDVERGKFNEIEK